MQQSLPILITGADTLPGRLLLEVLRRAGFCQLLCLNAQHTPQLLAQYCAEAGFVLHLADMHCVAGSTGLTETLLCQLEAAHNAAPVVFVSSSQAEEDSPMGESQQAAERAVFAYGDRTGNPVYVFRTPTLFAPEYCQTILADPSCLAQMDSSIFLLFAEDFANSLLHAFEGAVLSDRSRYPICRAMPIYEIAPQQLIALLQSFTAGQIPMLPADSLEQKLYHTYLSSLSTPTL